MKCSQNIVRLVVGSLCILGQFEAFNPTVIAQVPQETTKPAEGARDVGLFLYKSMLTGREQLQSGRCIITETETNNKNDSSRVKGILSVSFDTARSARRLEYDHQYDPELSFKCVESAEETALYSPATNILQIRSPEFQTRKSRPENYLDPRSFGFPSRHELMGTSLSDIRSLYQKVIGPGQYIEGVLGEKNTSLATLTIRGSQVKRTIIIAPQKNHAPVRMFVHYSDKENGGWSEPIHTVETEWKSISGVWVPVKLTFENSLKIYGGTKSILDINWLSVNESLPPKFFRSNNLSLPTDVTIGDARLEPGRVIIIKPATDRRTLLQIENKLNE